MQNLLNFATFKMDYEKSALPVRQVLYNFKGNMQYFYFHDLGLQRVKKLVNLGKHIFYLLPFEKKNNQDLLACIRRNNNVTLLAKIITGYIQCFQPSKVGKQNENRDSKIEDAVFQTQSSAIAGG